VIFVYLLEKSQKNLIKHPNSCHNLWSAFSVPVPFRVRQKLEISSQNLGRTAWFLAVSRKIGHCVTFFRFIFLVHPNESILIHHFLNPLPPMNLQLLAHAGLLAAHSPSSTNLQVVSEAPVGKRRPDPDWDW
jgi:hypothetical protein